MTLSVESTVRPLAAADRAAVVELDARLTGSEKPAWWSAAFEALERDADRVGLAAVAAGRLEGYLLGEVRAFEFGSTRCGWVLALGVRPDTARRGVASKLLTEARRRFRALGVERVRTMVQRTDVPMLSLFRSQGFVGGPYVQLELRDVRLEEERR